ncbi:hypothetical protein [Enterobacter cloacae]|uniref:hypothetical protein n=1 Tax=Enterobacter cloacae TaxID=550 RepID=UPI001A13628B|nr:hypothetical protein [Enterobacter cloacae]
MQNKIANTLYATGMLACIAFPYALYIHNNNPNGEAPKAQFVNDIRYSIDTCSFLNGNIIVKGWAFPTKGQQVKITRLFVDIDNKVYQLHKKTTKTEDVKKLFSGEKQYGMVGFYGSKYIKTTSNELILVISIEDTDGNIHETKYKCK